MRDFRFHLASLMAVFLALGLGITLGYTLVVSEKIDPLHSQIQQVRKQNTAVQDENKKLQQANDILTQQRQEIQNEVDDLRPLAVEGRLAGRTVSVISVGPPPAPSLVDAVWRALIAADARRLNEVVIRGSLLPTDPRAAQEIASRLQASGATAASDATGSSPGSASAGAGSSNSASTGAAPADSTPSDSSDALSADAVAAGIAGAIATGRDPTLLAALIHRGAPVDAAGDFTAAPNLVVLISDVDSPERLRAVERGETPETVLVRAFQRAGIRVVECESSAAPESAASYFRRLGISSVDDVDTRDGQVSLVWACLGYVGHYGIRRSADSRLPDLGQS